MIADNRLGGNINIDLGKIIAGPDSDLSVKLGMYANNRVTGYRAYTNKSGLNLDRVRTNEEGLWANLDVAYGNLVAVQVAGGPSLQAGTANANIDDNKYNTNFLGKAGAQLLVSAIVRPIDGLAVSAAYSYDAADSNSGSFLTAQNGAMNVEAAIDLGKMLNTDWTFGLDVADKMFFGDSFGNLFLATVYGGVDAFQLAVEYGVATQGSQDVVMPLYVGADINAVDRLLLNAYFGAKDVCTFADTWYLGANVGYEVYTGITLALNVQYATATAADFIGGDIDEFSVGAAGFSITPKMVIAF